SPAGRRADGERRCRASAADCRPAARDVPGGKRVAGARDAHAGSGAAVPARGEPGRAESCHRAGRDFKPMSLFKIAWRSIQERALASTMTSISMALGVALVVAVLVFQGVIANTFNR